jgi:hypothetical protein
MVIEQQLGIAEIIQPGWPAWWYHLGSHFGLGRESVAWADCTCVVEADGVLKRQTTSTETAGPVRESVCGWTNDGDVQASHSLEWSMERDSAQDAYHSIGRRGQDEGGMRILCRMGGVYMWPRCIRFQRRGASCSASVCMNLCERCVCAPS